MSPGSLPIGKPILLKPHKSNPRMIIPNPMNMSSLGKFNLSPLGSRFFIKKRV